MLVMFRRREHPAHIAGEENTQHILLSCPGARKWRTEFFTLKLDKSNLQEYINMYQKADNIHT
jgi:hypothetical protein